MTAGQKAGATNHARHEADKERRAAERADRQRAIEVCRQIRDDPSSTDRDKLDAIQMLRELTA